MGSIKKILESTPISDLAKNKPVIVLEHNSSVGKALQTLAMHNILSAPLIASPDLEDNGGTDAPAQLLGWLDVADILTAFLEHLKSEEPEVPVRMLALMTALERQGPIFSDKMLITIRGSEDHGLIYGAEGENTSVLSAIKDLFLQKVNNTRATHRIALFDAHGEITSIISQMDVCRWLLDHKEELGPTAHKSIEELGLLSGKPPVFTIDPHEPALIAYSKMVGAGVSGAPVITDSGEFIANLSISDLRALTSEHFGALALPVAEFLAVEHHTAYIGYSVKTSQHAKQPFFARGGASGRQGDIQVHVCNRKSTLFDVLRAFVEHHIHRVYVVEQVSPLKVDAVLTMTDILRFLGGVW